MRVLLGGSGVPDPCVLIPERDGEGGAVAKSLWSFEYLPNQCLHA